MNKPVCYLLLDQGYTVLSVSKQRKEDRLLANKDINKIEK